MHKQVARDCMCADIKRKSSFFISSVDDYDDLTHFDHHFWQIVKKENRPVGQRCPSVCCFLIHFTNALMCYISLP